MCTQNLVSRLNVILVSRSREENISTIVEQKMNSRISFSQTTGKKISGLNHRTKCKQSRFVRPKMIRRKKERHRPATARNELFDE